MTQQDAGGPSGVGASEPGEAEVTRTLFVADFYELAAAWEATRR